MFLDSCVSRELKSGTIGPKLSALKDIEQLLLSYIIEFTLDEILYLNKTTIKRKVSMQKNIIFLLTFLVTCGSSFIFSAEKNLEARVKILEKKVADLEKKNNKHLNRKHSCPESCNCGPDCKCSPCKC